MNIEISEHTAKQIEAIVGVSDQATLSRIMDRIASDEQLLLSLAFEPNESDVDAIREGLADVDAGQVQPFSEFDAELRKEMGFDPPQTNQ